MAPASAAASAHWPATVEQETKLKGVRRAAEYLFPTEAGLILERLITAARTAMTFDR
jgi:hypothetical protein